MSERDDAYAVINGRVTDDVLAMFRSKQADHPGQGHFLMLGSKGQFAELNKKFWKLYHAVWNDNDLIGEDPVEVASDMVGHLLLMIYCLKKEEGTETGTVIAVNCSVCGVPVGWRHHPSCQWEGIMG